MKDVNKLADIKSAMKECIKGILKIGTEHCGMCNLVESNITALEIQYPMAAFLKVDAENCDDDVLDEFGVRNVPLTIFYKDGEIVDKRPGIVTKDDVKKFLD